MGLLDFGTFELLDLLTFALWDFGTFGLLDIWTFGLWEFWTLGLLDFWTLGLLDFGTFPEELCEGKTWREMGLTCSQGLGRCSLKLRVPYTLEPSRLMDIPHTLAPLWGRWWILA